MSYGMYYFGKGNLSQLSYDKFVQYDSLASNYLNATRSFTPGDYSLLDELFNSINGNVHLSQK